MKINGKLKSVFFLSIHLLVICTAISAQQNSDNQFSKPLKEVLNDVQKRYGVTIKVYDSLVSNKMVSYADWKYRSDVETTLDNILKPLELKVKSDGVKKYKLSVYEYYRWTVEDGWKELDRISSKYNNLNDWEKRKDSLRSAILDALQLSKLPASPNTKPIITTQRKLDGYTIENIAIEYLPGVWVNGSLYKPSKITGKIPVILHPQGHWEKHRYRADCQYTSAAIAKMGAMIFSYDMFAWGESLLQFNQEDHRKSLAMSLQVLASKRILDYLLTLKEADPTRVAIAGGSGGGTQTILVAALDKRITASAPIVSLSSYFYGGCPCESGMPVQQCLGGTDNVEIAAMAAPNPQLIVSDGGDWTDKMPEHDFLYLKKVYGYFNAEEQVSNVHLPKDKHDFGFNKRKPLYEFLAKTFNLNLLVLQNDKHEIVDTLISLEPENNFFVFGDKGEYLPANAVKGFATIEKLFYSEIAKAK